jgi:PhnB protein
MARTGTYLNFPRNTEEVFTFYKSVFGGDFVDGKINRFGEIPPQNDAPPIPEEDKNLVMHVALPILGGHMLMGTDAPESMGFKVYPGNNVYISLHPDSREEADRLFAALSVGGEVEMPLQDMFWGDYYGSFTDKYGIRWMVNYAKEK